MIFGIRAVIEAVEAGKDIDKILIKKDLQGELVQELFASVKGQNIVVQRVPIEKINRITRKNHQGVVAFISAVTYQKLENIIPSLYEEGKIPFIVVLDGVTDVRNFGADAIVIPERNSVSVNADAIKTSAGALHHIPVCREYSVFEAIRFLQNSGLRIVAATEKASCNYTSIDYCGPVAIVMGAEDTGVSADVLKICDHRAALPLMGTISSLNVSVAAGIMMYEVVRQRMGTRE